MKIFLLTKSFVLLVMISCLGQKNYNQKKAFEFVVKSDEFASSNFDSCLHYTKLAKKYFEQDGDETMVAFSELAIINLFYLFKDFKKFETEILQLHKKISSEKGIEYRVKASLLNSLAAHQLILGNSDQAQEYFHEAISLLNRNNYKGKDLVIYHSNLGDILLYKGEVERAILEFNIASRKLHLDSDVFSFRTDGKIHAQLAMAYAKLEDYSNVEINLKKCLDKWRYQDSYLIGELDLFQQLFSAFNSKKNKKYATFINDNFLKPGYIKLRDSCTINYKFLKSIECHIMLNFLDIDHLNQKQSKVDLQKLVCNMYELSIEKYPNVFYRFLKQYYNFLRQNNKKEFFFPLEIDSFEKKLFFENYLEPLKKLDLYNSKAETEEGLSKFEIESLIEFIKEIGIGGNNISWENSLNELVAKIQKRIITGIMKEENNDLIFEIFELNKSRGLSDEVKTNSKYQFKSESFEIFEELEETNNLINKLKLEFSKSDLKSNIQVIENYQDNLSFYLRKKESLIFRLRRSAPHFYKSLITEDLTTKEKVQTSLNNDECLIEYIVDKSGLIFVLAISKDDYEIKELSEYCDILYFELEKVGQPYVKSEVNFEKLYESLLKPIESIIKNKKKLIIVPDGMISNIPFEILKNDGRFLIEDYVIQYQYSYKLKMILDELEDQKSDYEKDFFGVSYPAFGSDYMKERTCIDNPAVLTCSDIEINLIENLLGMDSTKSDLSKDQFLSHNFDSKILHIATHSCPDEENHNLNRIYFKDGYLTNYEISVMDIQAELVVLSACQTGIGKYVEGEGAISIAKAFVQAGAKSVIVSLWSVDDCNTAIFMKDIYRHLKMGKPVDEALRDVKIGYLDGIHPDLANPFYWAGFVSIGANPVLFPEGKIEKITKGGKWWILFLVFGAGVFVRRKVSKSRAA